MEEKNRWTSVVLFLSAPFIFLIISNQGPPAVGLLLNEASWAPFAYYGVSFGIGYLLFRRSRVVKDMEWHRSKNIQRLDKVYRAEDRGVWLRADAADERLTVEAQRRPVDSRPKVAARLQGSIADVNREGEPEEIESSTEEAPVPGIKIFGSILFASGLIKVSMNILFFISLIIVATGTYAIRGLYFSVLKDGKIPYILSGTAIGLISMVGYSPDIFATPLYGYLLDNYPGIKGHQYVYLILFISSIVGIYVSLKFKKLNNL